MGSRTTTLLLAAAACLLLPGLGQSFRSDEVWSLHAVAMPLADMLRHLAADIHPPLFYLVLRGWVALAGESEVATRLLTALLHLTAAAVVFTTARPRIGADRAAVCAAILIASPLGIVAAQLLRMYSLLELTAALSLLCWLRFVDGDRPSRLWWTGLVLSNVAGTFTHIWFLFLLAAIASAHLLFWRWRRFPWMLAAALASLLPWSIIWLPILLSQASHSADNLAWLKPPSWSAPVEVALMQAGVAVLLLFRRPRADTRDIAVPATVWAMALSLPFTLSLVAQPLFWARFTVVALPALALALGTWISGRFAPRAALAAVVTLSALLVAGLAAARTDECDARWTARWVAEHSRPGDLVVFTNLSRLPVEHYWRATEGARADARSFPSAIDRHPGYEGRIDPAEAAGELAALAGELSRTRRGQRLILLHGFDPAAHAPLVAAFDARFRREPAECLRCVNMANYFREITVWQIPE